MSTYASIAFTVNGVLSAGDVISFSASSGSFASFIETGVSSSTSDNEFLIFSADTEYQAINILVALERDYESEYDVDRSFSTVTITATDLDVEFSDIVVPTNMSYVYTEPVVSLEIIGVTVQAADDDTARNTTCRYNIAVSDGSSSYSIAKPVTDPDPAVAPFLSESELYFDYDRHLYGEIVQISTYDESDELVSTAEYTLPLVDRFYIDELVITEASSGATVVCNIALYEVPSDLGDAEYIETTREYSTDNSTWYESNTFTITESGDYTMYVRDDLGALFTEDFTISGVSYNKPDPQFIIPAANPLRFIETVDYGCSTVRNWNNCLLNEFLQYQPRSLDVKCYNQIITDCDEIITQILTNYDNISVSIKDSDGVEVLTPTAEVKAEYIGLYDMRDAILFQDDDDGYTLIAFSGGNTYDPDTSEYSGYYTNTAKTLPDFTTGGLYYEISGTDDFDGTLEPVEEYYDSDSGYWTIKLNKVFTGDSETVTCQCLTYYNEKLYNTVEFTTAGASLDTGVYITTITGTDDDTRYEDVEFISEPLQKLASTFNTVAFDYSHSENTQNLDFDTGVVFRHRLYGRFFEGTTDEDDDSFVTDYGAKTVQKSVITETRKFESHLIPFYETKKLSIISGMSSFSINGEEWVKGEDAEASSMASDRNPFQLVTRNYQNPAETSVFSGLGITTDTSTAIGSTSTIAIGT